MFESTIDNKMNVSDIDNNINVDIFMFVYDQNSQ